MFEKYLYVFSVGCDPIHFEIFAEEFRIHDIPYIVEGPNSGVVIIKVPRWYMGKARLVCEYANLRLNYIRASDELKALEKTVVCKVIQTDITPKDRFNDLEYI